MPTGKALHKILENIKTAFFAAGAVFLTCFAAWAAGIVVPAGSRLNVNDGVLRCELDQPCSITNDGVIQTTTGEIHLNGDWTTGNAAYYDAGTGTVFLSAAGWVQNITPGVHASDGFYNLTHVGVGTAMLAANSLKVNNDFNNLAGTFDASGITMNVFHNWVNTSSFIHSNNTVNLTGDDQAILGETTFYNLDKHLAAAASNTLTLEATKQQVVKRSLTLRGIDGLTRLNLVSSNPGGGAVPALGNSAKLQLMAGGIQNIANVAVSDNDARGGVTLVGRQDSQNNLRNQNWLFGSVTIKWDGSENHDWNNPFNWNLGIVPEPLDTAIIRAVDEDNGNAPILNQPVLNVDLTGAARINALEIRQNASLTLNEHNMAVNTLTTNSGTIILAGTETFTSGTMTQNPTSVFKYVGVPAGVFNADITSNFIIGGSTLLTYQGLAVDGLNAVPANDRFSFGSHLVVAGDVVLTKGAVTVPAGITLTVNGTATFNGAAVNAQSGSMVLDNFILSNGSYSAPAAGGTFSVAGDFTHSGGTFTPNDGVVIFNGTNAGGPSNQTIRGDTGFYDFFKQAPTAWPHTLTFWSGDTFMVSHMLTMAGFDGGHLLNIVSSTPGTAANLRLLVGGAQDIQNVSVTDNNASGGSLLVGRALSVGVSNYTNWIFGPVGIKWTAGALTTAWENPFNWDIGTVPIAEDTAMIRTLNDATGFAIVQQPVIPADVSVGILNIRDAGASLTLNGHNLTVKSTLTPPGSFINNGTLILNGNENLDLPLPYHPAAGTILFRGDGAGTAFNITGAGMPAGRPSEFFNLTIQNPSAGTASIFTANQNLQINGNLNVNGASLNAGPSSVDVAGSFLQTAGNFTAPGSTKSFTVAGNFTNTAGLPNFIANGGTIVFDGTSNVGASEQVIAGTSAFFSLTKTVPAGAVQIHQLTFDNTGAQTVSGHLTMTGIVGNPLQLRSTSVDPDAAIRDANISLLPNGLQTIGYVDVKDSDASASSGLWLVARNVSVNNGNNTHWIFGIPSVTWTGRVSTDWGDPNNWNLGLVPIVSDDVIIAAAANQPHLTAASGAVSLRDLTLEADTTLYLDSRDLTVTGAFSNNGNIVLRGTEAVAITNPDTINGKFTYTGDGTGTPINLNIFDPGHTPLTYHDLAITGIAADVFRPATNLVVNGALTISGGTLDVSTGIHALTVAENTNLTGGKLEAMNGSLALGSVILNGGTLSAPKSGNSFTEAGSWTNTAGTFTTNNGRVTFNGTAAATFSGNTTFYDLFILVPSGSKSVFFSAGSNQTVTHNLSIAGNKTNNILLRSTIDGTPWTITTALPIAPVVTNVDVRDSIAVIPGGVPYIIALNSIDQLNGGVSSNSGWRFMMLDIIAPIDNRTVGQTPTLIGHGVPHEVVTIVDQANAVVATVRADVNGNYRVVLGQDDAVQGTVIKTTLDVSAAANDRSLTPLYTDINGYTFPGNTNLITVVAAPTTAQVPVIDSPVDGELLWTDRPIIRGRAKPGATIEVVSKNEEGPMLLTIPPEAYVGSGVVNNDGTFEINLSRGLMRGFNAVSVLVDGVSSAISTFVVHDVSGVVFDSWSNDPMNQAVVTLLKADGSMPVPGVDINPTTINPYVTGPEGRYRFMTAGGSFKIVVQVPGYQYPSTYAKEKPQAGRVVVLGSFGEEFVMTGGLQSIDQPIDPTPYIFKIEKKANKTEARVGEVVTYTVSIENMLDENSIAIPRLFDNIPPGFKYMDGRAQLDGAPMPDPTGNRPLSFAVGGFAPHEKKVVRYQLVIGAGVIPGDYENTAVMKYANGAVISNNSHQIVQVVLDPLFDAGSIFGKVFYDLNENGRQDDPDYIYEERQEVVEGPVSNVRLVMEDGTVVTADKNGQFHITALVPGRHLLRIDERSLPPGMFLTTGKVQVVDVTPGSITKVNFGVSMDNAQVVGKDVEFFQKDFQVDQEPSQPKPRLNVNMFNENILLHNDAVIEQIEFRIFNNYTPFIISWQLDIMDADTKKLVRSFNGARTNIYDPVYWDGRDLAGKYIQADRQYAYVVKVRDEQGQWDETKEQLLALKVMSDQEMTDRQRVRSDAEKVDEAKVRAGKYRKYLIALNAGNALKAQNIWVKGDTVVLRSSAVDVRQIRVLKHGELYAEVPVLERQGLTAHELLDGASAQEQSLPMEIILPDGDYELEVASAVASGPGGGTSVAGEQPITSSFAESGAGATSPHVQQAAVPMQRYRKPLKVGEDYMMFVAMGDGKVGYNVNRGSIEPVKNNNEYAKGFYSDGKLAYYLKGKIKGKYIVTSSFDTERLQKKAMRTFKDDDYYPVYGDASTVNYDAADTEGPLYLSVEWDKSQAIWGNYAVAFNNTEFANYTRTLYGGKLDYKTVASTQYGEPKTNVVVFHAEVRQRSAHNELLATGGSLYYLKNQDIVKATDKLKVEVRDAATGLVKSSFDLKSGVDYDVDCSNGRILFWRPVSMVVASNTLINNGLLNGDPVYVIVDYEYFINDHIAEATRGTRITQALGKDVVAGATLVSETQAGSNYQLKGEDLTFHVGKDATVNAEYAQTSSKAQNNFISTDGGITFTELASSSDISGKAYGIRQDARLFDRVGLKSYYKWIDSGFSTAGTSAQQGKELKGMAMTFDLTPVTRLTATHDIQRLMDRDNLQANMQVGAQETATSMVQVVHDARRLRLTYEFQRTQVRNKNSDYVATTNTQGAAAAMQAEYTLNEKTDLLFRHQVALLGPGTQSTTLGVKRQLTNKLSGNLEETFGSAGLATRVGLAANVTPRLALNTDYTLTRDPSGQFLKTVALGGKGQINDKTSLQTTASVTQSAPGQQEKTVAIGSTTKVGDNTDVSMGVETTQSADAGKSRQALTLGGAKHGKDGRETTTGVKVEDTMAGGHQTVITAGEKGQLSPQMQMATEKSYAYGDSGVTNQDTYKIARSRDGHTVETSYALKHADNITEHSDSNIFGLTGDINDRLSFLANLETGKVQNVDGSITARTVIAGGLGYVEKDKESGQSILQSSSKAEVRFDKGPVDKQQYVVYQSTEGKVNEQTTVRGKFSYSTTRNMATKKAEAGYKEIMLGGAYRPVAVDRLNLFGEYTYKENKGPMDQAKATEVEETRMHVVTVGGALELDEKWELVEKLAMRIMQEKVTGFEFTKTHTWLVVNRLNYAVNQDWKIGAEYRMLAVKEAQDKKAGFLLEAVHSMNDNVELGIGYNFTNFVDDLTNLDYTIQGPFLRMTGKLYDQSPAERARAKARWIDHRIDIYAKKMLKDEFSRKDGPIVVELNTMYQLAQSANVHGKYEDARQIYKDIITVTQMMYQEAAQFVRQHIALEENIYNAFGRAKEYYDKGEFWQARKLWEKIVEEASRAVLE